MHKISEEELEGLDTTIDWKNTGDNSYDGEKLTITYYMMKVVSGKNLITY